MAKLLTGTRIYGTGTVDTQLLINGGIASSSTATGALRVFGGAGISGDIWVGGTIYGNISGTITGVATTASNLQGGTAGQVPYQTGPGATGFFGPGTAGQLLVSAGAAAPVYTNTSSIYVGRSVLTDDIVGGATGSLPYQDNANSTVFLGIGTAGQILLSTGSAPSWVNTSTLLVGNSVNVGVTNDVASTTPHFVTFVSTTTGYTGIRGAGMSGITYVPSTGNFGLGINTPIYRLDVAGGARFTGITTVTNTTAATSADTGALQVDGGIGVNGNGWFGGNVYAGSASANYLELDGNATGTGPNIIAAGSDANIDILYSSKATGSHSFRTNSSVRQFQISHTASAVNYAQVTGAATGANPILSLQGTDGDVGLTITPKNLGRIIVSSTASASSTATGALVVTGGVGINENLYVGGNSVLTGDLAVNGGDITTTGSAFNLINSNALTVNFAGAATSLTMGANGSGTTTIRNNLNVSINTSSSGTTNGALVVTGGVGIGGNLYVGGTIFGNVSVSGSITTATNITGGTAGQIPYQTAPGTTAFFGPGTAGQILISGGTGAPSYVNTSTFHVGRSTTANSITGGAAGSIPYQTAADSTAFLALSGTQNSLLVAGASAPQYVTTVRATAGSGSATTSTGQSLQVTGGGLGVSGDSYFAANLGVRTNLKVEGNTNATSQTTGALQVVGGIGAQGDIYAAGAVIDNVRIGVTAVNEIDTSAGNLILDSTGGTVEITDNLSVTGNATITGNLTVQGTTTVVDSTVTNVADPILTIGGLAGGAAPTSNDNKDRGIAFQWHNGVNARVGFMGYDASTGYFTFLTSATIANEVVAPAGGTTRAALDANLSGGTAQALVYQSAANTTGFIAAGTAGYILQTNGTGSAPTWVAPTGLSAGSTAQIQTITRNTNAVHYLTFVDSDNATATSESVYTSSLFAVNPSNGYVGLGISSPQTSLDAIAPANNFVSFASTISAGQWAGVHFGYRENNTSYRKSAIVFERQDGSARGKIHILNNGNADTTSATLSDAKITIEFGGNVGIGTTAPAFSSGTGLEIQRTGTATLRLDSASFATELRGLSGGTEIFQLSAGYLDLGTNAAAVMRIHSSANVTIGTTTDGGYKLQVNGSFAATTKSFVIDHPTKPGKKLRYGSLEGPENGVYVRGRLKGKGVIELPDYWTGLVDEASITVDLTPIGKHQKLFVKDVKNNKVYIGGSQKINCFYTVWAERKDVDKLDVEID